MLVIASGADVGGDTDSGPSTARCLDASSCWACCCSLLARASSGAGDRKPGEVAAAAEVDGCHRQTSTPAKALGLGFLLAAVNPKNLLMCIGGGVAVADGDLDGGDQVVAIAVFTVIAASTVRRRPWSRTWWQRSVCAVPWPS